MFFRPNNLQDFISMPDELVMKIIFQLPVKDLLDFIEVASRNHEMTHLLSVMKNGCVYGNYWSKYGVSNFDDFKSRISNLPILFQECVINGQYDIPLCEKVTQAIYGRSSLKVMEALCLLLPSEQQKNIRGYWNPFAIFKEILPEYSAVIPRETIYEGEGNSRMMRATAIGFLEKRMTPAEMASMDPYKVYDMFIGFEPTFKLSENNVSSASSTMGPKK